MEFLNPVGRWFGLFFCLLALAPQSARAQTKEYQIKAAFLLNFIQFVEWPAAAFSGSNAPLCIGVLGDDPFGNALEETVRGESVRDHKLSIRRAQRVEDLTECKMVFVSKSENKRVPEILAKIDSHPVVTVSEVEGFARQGGTINFYHEQNKVRFEINPASARQSGVKISSQLLGLGKIVESPPGNK
jgi:hypothetical protein